MSQLLTQKECNVPHVWVIFARYLGSLLTVLPFHLLLSFFPLQNSVWRIHKWRNKQKLCLRLLMCVVCSGWSAEGLPSDGVQRDCQQIFAQGCRVQTSTASPPHLCQFVVLGLFDSHVSCANAVYTQWCFYTTVTCLCSLNIVILLHHYHVRMQC